MSSVPSPSVAQATMAATLVDEWCRLGLTDVVLCPGSRSTPLALAVANREDLTVHVRLDERGAGFFALGRSRATGRPCAIVVTSGTAAAELHPAVAEADLAGVPLLVLTADRPPELHDVGAAQTIEQRHLFGRSVRRFDDLGIAYAGASSQWRPAAARLWAAASGNRPGPVHLNVPLVEPLLASAGPLPEGRGSSPWVVTGATRPPAVEVAVEGRRCLCVAGLGAHPDSLDAARALGWVVLGDVGAREGTPYYDALLRDDDFADRARPDVIVRLGGMPSSKVLAGRIAQWGCEVHALEGEAPVADPDGVVTHRFAGRPDPTSARSCGDPAYVEWWQDRVDVVASRVEPHLRATWGEAPLAAAVVRFANERGWDLVVGSSMPVRDVEWWAPPRHGLALANRGANGIDGVISTALAVATGASAVALVGDLTFLHDLSGLVDGIGTGGGRLALVVADNGGGGIFSFLAQATTLAPAPFERLFATPRPVDQVALAKALGHHGERVGDLGALESALDAAARREGVSVIVAELPRPTDNVVAHEALIALAREAAEP